MYEVETKITHGGFAPNKCSERMSSVHFNCYGDEETRIDNTTKVHLEDCIAMLEHAQHALCFPSGTSAMSSIARLVDNGGHVILFDSVYHGTRTYLKLREDLGQIEVTFVDLRNPNVLRNYLKENTQMVWIETPCNPTIKLVDISAIAKIIKEHKKSILVVDNTFMSPYFQNPLLLGADIVMHSMTKYMNGHSDVLMGAIATNSESSFKRLKDTSIEIGSLPSPMDCYLALRGLRTLHIRMDKHMSNAMQVAKFLESHPNVEKVFYPGLRSHPQHDLALRQCNGFSGMVSFCVKGGTEEVKKFGSKVKVFTLAVSLGCMESLLDIPSLMTASALTKTCREELGITDNLVRLSIGLEDAKDLIEDLNQALY